MRRTNGRGDRLPVAVLVAVLVMVGPALVVGPVVRGADAGESPAPTSASPAAAAASVSAAPSGWVTLPDAPAATRLQWVFNALDAGAEPLTVAEISDAFSPTFLAQVTTDQLTQAFVQIAAPGPSRSPRTHRRPTASRRRHAWMARVQGSPRESPSSRPPRTASSGSASSRYPPPRRSLPSRPGAMSMSRFGAWCPSPACWRQRSSMGGACRSTRSTPSAAWPSGPRSGCTSWASWPAR